jgi:hypothetical protein
MREAGIGVLQVSDGHCEDVSQAYAFEQKAKLGDAYRASG